MKDETKEISIENEEVEVTEVQESKGFKAWLGKHKKIAIAVGVAGGIVVALAAVSRALAKKEDDAEPEDVEYLESKDEYCGSESE